MPPKQRSDVLFNEVHRRISVGFGVLFAEFHECVFPCSWGTIDDYYVHNLIPFQINARATTCHFPLRASTSDATGAGSLEDIRCYLLALCQHQISHMANLILRPIKTAQTKEVKQLEGIHGEHQIGFRGIRQH